MGVGLAMVIAVTFGIAVGTMLTFFPTMSLEEFAGLGPLVLFTGGREKGGESESGGNERGLHAWQVNLSDCPAHTSGQTRPRKAETVKRGYDKMTDGVARLGRRAKKRYGTSIESKNVLNAIDGRLDMQCSREHHSSP